MTTAPGQPPNAPITRADVYRVWTDFVLANDKSPSVDELMTILGPSRKRDWFEASATTVSALLDMVAEDQPLTVVQLRKRSGTGQPVCQEVLRAYSKDRPREASRRKVHEAEVMSDDQVRQVQGGDEAGGADQLAQLPVPIGQAVSFAPDWYIRAFEDGRRSQDEAIRSLERFHHEAMAAFKTAKDETLLAHERATSETYRALQEAAAARSEAASLKAQLAAEERASADRRTRQELVEEHQESLRRDTHILARRDARRFYLPLIAVAAIIGFIIGFFLNQMIISASPGSHHTIPPNPPATDPSATSSPAHSHVRFQNPENLT